MDKANVNGVELEYEVRGSGEPVLLISNGPIADTFLPLLSEKALVDRYRLGVSSATVRAILADLEAAGLLTHPHTSAGRIPTDTGYRFYVESLADTTVLPAVEQLMIRHQFGQVEFASEHWFRLAATTLEALA